MPLSFMPVSSVSYPIPSPSHIQLLLSSPLSPEQRDIAETILDSGNSLLGILGDILDFSKLDHGEVVLQRQELSLRGTIEACIEVSEG